MFAKDLEDWVDWDQAAYVLGLRLGAITAEVPFSKSKRLFWEDGPVSRGLHAALLALVEAGLLEARDEEAQFRWVSTKPLNVFD